MQNTQTVERLKAIVDAHQRNSYAEMRDMARELLSTEPENASANYLYGLALCNLKEFAQGITALQRAVALCPDSNEELLVNTQSQIGTALRKMGKTKEAEHLYRKLIKKFPEQLAVYGNLSFLLNDQKRYKETIRLLQPFIKRKDIDQGYIINFGNAQRGLGNLTVAKEAYTRALNMGGCWNNGALANLAMLDFQDGRLEKAKEQLLQLHAEQACPPEGYLNLALIETDLHNHREALNWLTYVDDANFMNTSSIVNFVNNKSVVNEPLDAVVRIHDWLEHHPLDISLLCAWISMGQKHCLFEELRRAEPLLLQQFDSKNKLRIEEHSLFGFMAIHAVTAKHLLRAAEASAQNFAKNVAQQASFHHSPRSHPRLRIGYLSPDFRDHPVAHLMIGIFANHDREKFEVYGYNIGKADHTVYRYRSIGYLDEFRECRELSFEDLARQIYDDDIDVLVDLCGYTEHCKPKALCYKPAPVIISYLGFVGTMGLPQVDYIIADSIVMPRALEPFHTEKPIRLPRCYQATDGTLEVERVSRAEMGLPETTFVFVSFNNTYKLNPHFVGLWAEILHRCPNAVLWLYASGVAKDNLIAEFQRLGVEPSRLYFFTRQSKARFLGALALADLFLDSSPYNAGTTASDALFAGCPVLTLPGETYSSRMCASIVTHAGLPELVVDSEEAYVALACRMYADPAWRQAVRTKAEHARTSRLFDTVDATRCLEAAYRTAYDRFAAGKKPAPLTIPDPGWSGGDALRPFAGRRIGLEEAKGIAAKLEKIGGTEAVEKLWQVLKPAPKNKTAIAGIMKKTVLHVGCGPQHILGRYGFSAEIWQECRLDIDPGVKPDVISSMTDMSTVADGSVDAVYSSHNIEHLYAHEVPLALREFCRVLKDEGLLVLTCPDLQSVCALVAEGKLLTPAYHTGEGQPIAPLDILYGWRPAMAQGNLFMAHRCGFTAQVLSDTLVSCGFAKVASMASPSTFALFAVASKSNRSDEEMRELATRHNML